MKRTKTRLYICITLLVINLTVIWGNSLLPGNLSGAISNAVKDFVLLFLPMRPGGPSSGGGLIRKLAHFTEFACLGVVLSWLIRMLTTQKLRHYLLPLFGGVLAACVDETIQRFVPDRGPNIFDVGIDTLGVVTGIVIISLIQIRKQKLTIRRK